MKLNAGILTEKLAETKAFYTQHLGFGVTFENEFYLLFIRLISKQSYRFSYQTIQPNNLFFMPHLLAKACT